MLLYRTIGRKELETLLYAKNPIYGSGRYQDLRECGCSPKYPYGIVCFFQVPVPFIDKDHEIEIVVDITKPMVGKGEYNVPKDFWKKPRFTHKGSVNIYLPEAYTRKYTIKEVKAINIKEKYPAWISDSIEKRCKEEGIEFYNIKENPFDLEAPLELCPSCLAGYFI